MQFKKALLGNSSWNIAGLCLTFANNILIVRLLGSAGSGTFFYGIAILTLLVIFLRLGIENGIVFYSSADQQLNKLLFFLLIPLGIIQAIAAFLLLSGLNLSPFSPALATCFIIANILLYYCTAFYQARKMFTSINVIALVFACVQTILLLCYFTGRDIFYGINIDLGGKLLYIITLTTMAQVCAAFIFFYLKQPSVPGNRKYVTADVLRKLFTYSGFSYINGLLLFLITRTDFYFVERYTDPVVLGNYVQAAKIGQMALLVPGFIGGVVFPYSIEAGPEFPNKVASLCRIVTALFIMFFVGLILTGFFVFPWLLGPGFQLVYHIILITIAGVFCSAIAIILISFFEGKNKQQIILYANLLTLGIIISCDFLFVERFGYLAAAIIFTVGNFAGLVVMLFQFTRQTGVKAKDLFILRKPDLERLLAK